MIPYPYKFVDFGGTDLSEKNGLVVEGIYQRIIDALNRCGEVVLYNWFFASIPIAPSYCTIEVRIDCIIVNGVIEIQDDDTVWVESLIPPPPDPPVIEPISLNSNGTYYVPEGVDGFNPVTVDVPPPDPPVIQPISVDSNGTYYVPEGVAGFNPVTVAVPEVSLPPFAIYDAKYSAKSFGMFGSSSGGIVPLTQDLYTIKPNWSLPFKITVRFKLDSIISRAQCLFGGRDQNIYWQGGPSVEVRADGNVWGAISTNGTSWTDSFTFPNGTISIGVWYTISVEYDGTDILVTLTDGETTLTRTIENIGTPYYNSSYQWNIGSIARNASLFCNNTWFDIASCSIESNGVRIW